MDGAVTSPNPGRMTLDISSILMEHFKTRSAISMRPVKKIIRIIFLLGCTVVLGATGYPPSNMVCDGVTNDAPALQATLNTNSGFAYIPVSANGCLLNSLVTYNSTTGGPIEIRGDGPKSKLLVNNATGGLQITSTPGTAYNEVFVHDLNI